MKRANRYRIVEDNLSEHVRQENARYRGIIRRNLADERRADDRLDPAADAHLFATGHLPEDF